MGCGPCVGDAGCHDRHTCSKRGELPVMPWARLESPALTAGLGNRDPDSGHRRDRSANVPRLRWLWAGGGPVTSALPGSDPAHLVIAELDGLAEPSVCVFPGERREVRNVRAFIGAAVDGCPAADDVILLASEVATNAIVHTASGEDGTFKVVVHALDGMVRVEVHDGGSETLPGIGSADDEAVSGRGLGFVEELATRWGHHGNRDGRVVWFEVDWQ